MSTHIPKELWPAAFVESKRMAEMVLSLNRKLQKYAKRTPEDMPTDRELTLAAGINIFYEYRLSQEASQAARFLFFQRLEQFVLSKMDKDSHQDKRLLKILRRVKNNDGGTNFLRMWMKVEEFLHHAKSDDFWKQFDKPSTCIKAFSRDLNLLAELGEENGEENREDGNQNGSTERQESPEGISDRPDGSADSRESESGSET